MQAVGWIAAVLLALGAAPPAGAAPAPVRAASRPPSRVNAHWRRAFVLSFRSPDLLSDEPDERWGAADDRLRAGGILADFPLWLKEQQPVIAAARAEGRPILLSLATHGGYGLGLVTYTLDLKRAQVANYPWLVRQLLGAGLGEADVTVAVDTCNAQAASAYQL